MNASSRCNKIARNAKNAKAESDSGNNRGESRPGAKTLLPALVALGGGCILAGPALAVELGDMTVHSTLGQPLRASVAFALHPNELIHDYCIYLKPGLAANGLPSIGNAAVTVADGAIRLTGRTAIKEPLLTLKLTVDCPYTAHLQREYTVFIDPGLPSQQAAAAAARRGDAPARIERRAGAASSAPAVTRTPIAASGTYRVQPGDSLSGIAARLSGRTVGIWQAVDVLFAANPGAFIDKDMNLLRAGAVLAIPDAILAPQRAGISPAVPASAGTGRAAKAPVPEYTGLSPAVSRPSTATDTAARTAAAAASQVRVTAATEPRRSAGDGASRPGIAVAEPGDVSLGSDSPFVSPIDGLLERSIDAIDSHGELAAAGPFAAPTEVIPATAIDNAASTRSAPVARSASGTTSDSWSWLIWLGGSGIALILGLLLFGRRLKERFGPVSAPDVFGRRRSDSADIDDTDVAPALGLPARGAAPVARVVSLDADLDDGSGFQYGGDIDVAQDFGFSDSGKFRNALDMDFSSSAPDGAEDHTTDIIASNRVEEATILISEIPPSHDETGEYDLSMVLDATKQRLGDTDDTTKDLRAIQVEAQDDDAVSEQLTLNKDVDYRIVEQDYEDELTATQALNAEIARAARALSQQMGKDEMGDTLTDETGDTVIEKTSQLPSTGGFAQSGDETVLLPKSGAEEIAADRTVEMPARAGTLDDTANEEITVAMPAAENDSTLEVEIESATIDTRKMRAS